MLFKKYTEMKTTIILTILAISFILVGCEEMESRNEDNKLNQKTEKRVHNIKQGDYEVLVIDGCQYILYQEEEGINLAYGYMSHKGNCNNSIHCYKALETISDTLKIVDNN